MFFIQKSIIWHLNMFTVIFRLSSRTSTVISFHWFQCLKWRKLFHQKIRNLLNIPLLTIILVIWFHESFFRFLTRNKIEMSKRTSNRQGRGQNIRLSQDYVENNTDDEEEEAVVSKTGNVHSHLIALLSSVSVCLKFVEESLWIYWKNLVNCECY